MKVREWLSQLNVKTLFVEPSRTPAEDCPSISLVSISQGWHRPIGGSSVGGQLWGCAGG